MPLHAFDRAGVEQVRVVLENAEKRILPLDHIQGQIHLAFLLRHRKGFER